MIYRIGDRDPVTGLYDVIWPDGSFTRNGIKIFNSAHEFGDVVLATQRSDGMMILDGVKATLIEIATNSFGLGGFDEQPVGYLAGQVFNNEDEVVLPTVSIEFAPGSPTELEPDAGDFVVRIKIDRPQRKDLRVKLKFAGTAESGDYTYTGLDGDLFAIVPAGELFFDVVVTPIANGLGVEETINVTIILTIIKLREYKIGQTSSVTAKIVVVLPFVTFDFVPGSPTKVLAGSGSFMIRVFVDNPQSTDLDIGCRLISYDGLDFSNFTSTSFYTGLSGSPRFILPANQSYVDLVLTPINPTLPFLSKTLYFDLPPDNSTPPRYDALTYGYLELQVVAAAIFIAKYVPYRQPSVYPFQVHPLKIYGSNTPRTGVQISMGSSATTESRRIATLPSDMTLLTAALGSSVAHRLRVVDETIILGQYPVRYAQFDLRLAKAEMDALGLRYLYVFIGGWVPHNRSFSRDSESWGSHSVQIVSNYLNTPPNNYGSNPPNPNVIGESLPAVPYGLTPIDSAEFLSPYVTTPKIEQGWIENQYLLITNTVTPSPTLVQLKAFCVQIDMQNLLDIKYVNPIPISPNSIYDEGSRTQLVNYP